MCRCRNICVPWKIWKKPMQSHVLIRRLTEMMEAPTSGPCPAWQMLRRRWTFKDCWLWGCYRDNQCWHSTYIPDLWHDLSSQFYPLPALPSQHSWADSVKHRSDRISPHSISRWLRVCRRVRIPVAHKRSSCSLPPTFPTWCHHHPNTPYT